MLFKSGLENLDTIHFVFGSVTRKVLRFVILRLRE
jgi:hypothetical protein